VATKKTVPSVVTKAAKKKAKKKKNRNKNKKKKTFAKVLNANRSLLSDAYAAPKNKIPAFLKESSGTRYVPNPRRGYRIQILSTRNADKADRVAKHFRLWADSVMVIYIPETYVRFKQPFYKVQVGDFQFYNRAQKLTHLLKRRYPGAWVVHDEIIP
jgi:septal ring-binding cell division protein DamX